MKKTVDKKVAFQYNNKCATEVRTPQFNIS